MRVLLVLVLVGCSDGGGESEGAAGGFVFNPDCDPKTSATSCCVETDDPADAPCCDPPTIEEAACPAGWTRAVVSNEAGTAVNCADPADPEGPKRLALGLDGDGKIVAYAAGDGLINCTIETGRAKWRFRMLPDGASPFGRFCMLGCWSAAGEPLDICDRGYGVGEMVNPCANWASQGDGEARCDRAEPACE